MHNKKQQTRRIYGSRNKTSNSGDIKQN